MLELTSEVMLYVCILFVNTVNLMSCVLQMMTRLSYASQAAIERKDSFLVDIAKKDHEI